MQYFILVLVKQSFSSDSQSHAAEKKTNYFIYYILGILPTVIPKKGNGKIFLPPFVYFVKESH